MSERYTLVQAAHACEQKVNELVRTSRDGIKHPILFQKELIDKIKEERAARARLREWDLENDRKRARAAQQRLEPLTPESAVEAIYEIAARMRDTVKDQVTN